MVTLFKPCEIARYTANRDNARFPSIFGCQLYLHILIKCFWRTKSFCNGCRHRCTKLIRSRFISSSYHQHIPHIREGSIASRRCHRLNQPVETCVDSFGNCFLSPFDTVHERKLPSTLWKCCVYFRECSFEHCLLLSLFWCWLWWSFWHPNLPNFICDFLHTSKCIIVCLSSLANSCSPWQRSQTLGESPKILLFYLFIFTFGRFTRDLARCVCVYFTLIHFMKFHMISAYFLCKKKGEQHNFPRKFQLFLKLWLITAILIIFRLFWKHFAEFNLFAIQSLPRIWLFSRLSFSHQKYIQTNWKQKSQTIFFCSFIYILAVFTTSVKNTNIVCVCVCVLEESTSVIT